MKVFDYLINPKLHKNLILKSFYFKPEDQEQENLGELCIVAELTESLSQDNIFLENLVSKIKKSFYQKNISLSPEEALRRGLSTANNYLKNQSLEGNTRWLGNLNLAIINLEGLNFAFSKTGNAKIFLLRNNEYLDIAENLEFQNPSKDYNIQAFPNVASGSLAKDDKIVVLTQGLAIFFQQELAQQIIEHRNENLKWLDRFLRRAKKDIRELSGILCLIDCNQPKKIKHFWPFGGIKLSKTKKNILLVLSFLLILLISYLVFR